MTTASTLIRKCAHNSLVCSPALLFITAVIDVAFALSVLGFLIMHIRCVLRCKLSQAPAGVVWICSQCSMQDAHWHAAMLPCMCFHCSTGQGPSLLHVSRMVWGNVTTIELWEKRRAQHWRYDRGPAGNFREVFGPRSAPR